MICIKKVVLRLTRVQISKMLEKAKIRWHRTSFCKMSTKKTLWGGELTCFGLLATEMQDIVF